MLKNIIKTTLYSNSDSIKLKYNINHSGLNDLLSKYYVLCFWISVINR